MTNTTIKAAKLAVGDRVRGAHGETLIVTKIGPPDPGNAEPGDLSIEFVDESAPSKTVIHPNVRADLDYWLA